MSQPVNLGPVQQTLLITLLARARETQNQNAILSDPKAVEMVNNLDYDFSKWDQSTLLPSIILRAMIYDADVLDFLQQHPNGTVVELGCGLNTRYERLDNGTAHWFDIDLPDVIELRRKYFKDEPRRKMIAGNLLESDWCKEVQETGGPWCFISEGAIVYLDNFQARLVITMLTEFFPEAWLVVDTTSQRIVDNQGSHDLMKVMPEDSWFKWRCDDPKEIEDWTDGKLQLIKSKTYLDAPSECWDRAPWFYWVLYKFFPRFVLRYLVKGYYINLLKSSNK